MRNSGDPARSARGRVRPTHLVALALALLLATAVFAPIGQASEGANRQAERNARQAERASRHSERMAEKEAAAQAREAERSAHREAHRLAREAEELPHKEKEGNVVKLSCKAVTIEYSGFPAVTGNSSVVYLTMHTQNKEGQYSSQPIQFFFDGTSAKQTIHVAFPIGRSLVDVHAKWRSNGHNGGFDIHGPVNCGPEPELTVEKLQTIEGGTLTKSPITGTVGQKVVYEVVVTNVGNTLLTIGFTDGLCNEGTISTTAEGAIEPGEKVTYFCTHTLTEADEKDSPLINIAHVTGSPEQGEGSTVNGESNPVEATVHSAEEKQTQPETPETKTETTAKQEVLSSSSSNSGSTGKSGVLGFASATVPALHAPQGCVRSTFTAYVRSAGVQSVAFYLDGHKLRTLTYRNAHKGLLSIRIDGSKLKVGAHRLVAKVTMKQTSPTAKAAKATRSVMIVRCKSAVLTPRFTG